MSDPFVIRFANGFRGSFGSYLPVFQVIAPRDPINSVFRQNDFTQTPLFERKNSSSFFLLPRIEFSSFSTKFRSNESRKIRSRFLSCVVRIVASYFTQSEPSKAAADIGRLPSITKKQLVELYKRDCRRGRPPRGIRIYHGPLIGR